MAAEDENYAFFSGGIVRRSPQRSLSVSNVDGLDTDDTVFLEQVAQQSAKRKKIESPACVKLRAQKKQKIVSRENIVEEIVATISKLKSQVAQNTANGLKKSIDILSSLSAQLTDLNDMNRGACVEVSTQCDDSTWHEHTLEKQAKEIRNKIENAENNENFEELININWPELLYGKTNIKVGNPYLDNRANNIVIMPLLDIDEIDKGIFKLAFERYPELNIPDNIDKDGIAHLCCSTTVVTTCNSGPKNNRHLLRATIPLLKYESIVEIIKKITKRIQSNDQNTLSIPKINGLNVEVMRKLVEIAIYNTDINVTIHVPQAIQPIGSGESQKTRKQYQTDALLLTQKNSSYRDLLLNFKNSASKNNLAENVDGVRKTKEGNLLITLTKGNKNAMQLKELIVGDLPQSNIKIMNNNIAETCVLNVKNLDSLVERKDIESSLKNILNTGQNDPVEILNIRPNNDETQTATIRISKLQAKILFTLKDFKIGLNKCKFEERIELERCYKCWRYDHKSKDCVNKDISKHCHNCGQAGHARMACSNERACPLCGVSGHAAGTLACKIFSTAFANEKRLMRKQRDNSLK